LIEAYRMLGRERRLELDCEAERLHRPRRLGLRPQKGGMMAVLAPNYRRLGAFLAFFACVAVVAAIVAAIAQAGSGEGSKSGTLDPWAYSLLHRAAGNGSPAYVVKSTGFGWQDAGVGAAATLGLVVLVGGGGVLALRRRRTLVHGA
jgi:hypothetical protein